MLQRRFSALFLLIPCALAANNTVPPASTVTQHPAAHPVAPAAQPVASGVQPVVAGVQPVVPGGQPVVPGVQPVAPGVQPIVPGVQPVVPGVPPGVPLVQQFTTAPQCKCDDIDKCTVEMADLTEMCKKEPVCESILARTGGDVAKIRSCLDDEHKVMTSIEKCVKESVNGLIGCTKDAIPQNLTIPLVPVVEIPLDPNAPAGVPVVPRLRRSATPESVNAPPELAQFLVCVDQCAMTQPSLSSSTRPKRSTVTCAYKLRCALAPPDAKIQAAFVACEKKLNINPEERFLKSCSCLKKAGISGMACETS